ncbi:hypothetical protein FQR65_LT15216 [Abscondita terminalis]|nr:hypothetical protein FQR65_LT15216 [Abscondita terminalis]
MIAVRSLTWGGNLNENDLITTNGGMNSLSFCLMALGKPGDTIAIESPCYPGILQLAVELGYKVLELPTHPITGDGGWKSSRGIEPLELDTERYLDQILIDDFTGDSDFDDLVREISLIYPNNKKFDKKFYEDFDQRANGPNGKKYFDPKKVIPELDKKEYRFFINALKI